MSQNTLCTVETSELSRMSSSDLGEMFHAAAAAVTGAKQTAGEIKSRGFWKRLKSNNTRDLAAALADQAKAMELFFRLLQQVTFLHMTNTVLLADLEEQLAYKAEHALGSQREYMHAAKEYISSALAAANAFHSQIEDVTNRVNRVDENVAKMRTELEGEIARLRDEVMASAGKQRNAIERVDGAVEEAEAAKGTGWVSWAALLLSLGVAGWIVWKELGS